MRKIKLYIASSLNGKISGKNGSVEWLEKIPNPDQSDYGYQVFCDSVDTTIQGYSTYKQIIDWGIEFPYKGKKNYVITSKHSMPNNEDVEFITQNPISRIREIKNEEGKDIWLIGGGQINTLLFNAKLIDEIIVFKMPYILSEGVNLFEFLPNEQLLQHKSTTTYPGGVVEIRYVIEN